MAQQQQPLLPQIFEAVEHGMCSECQDQPSILLCDQCEDEFCAVCFKAQHRKGKRASHTTQEVISSKSTTAKAKEIAAVLTEDPMIDARDATLSSGIAGVDLGEWFTERAKYIPVRLTMKERKYLRLLEAALSSSEYTNKIDTPALLENKAKKTAEQMRQIMGLLVGIMVAFDYETGQELMESGNFAQHERLFQDIFEIGRRHKIMNPEKMRAEYGKLVYLLQDSMIPEIRQSLGFSCVRPIKTVFSVLEELGGLDILRDEKLAHATREIVDDGIKTREMIRREIKMKEAAIEFLAKKYENGPKLKGDDIKRYIYSINDNNSFLTFNRDPVDKIIAMMEAEYSAEDMQAGYSLAIQGGLDGARLTHNHERQFFFVLQSLTLWRNILNDMFKLWYLAEMDLLCEGRPYKLEDTGQGLHRIQAAPNISRAMKIILNRTQERVGQWVGSSVIHLGDSNVPNALMFIDKYTQVPRILNPIVITLKQLDKLYQCEELKLLFDEFGGPKKLRKDILHDFFKFGFDGSGADNFFDAGSCIDGRLTSAWNWCSQLDKKPFYIIFKLTGFIGFDGDFQT